ncbi:hypothetical protein [Mastigocoleus sp. MO_188.B34]|uniref:hypothetical protein n=1 Tax=Mastigocoleus sp. MO_188.B34 TaxID=3036635 RepID=UPI002617B396|nr:hypothetical protein [Mastigocoleus sp. MO_188.B34]MDJ0696350.1 hypothetical protein [Mastigocoleus sp. MO_188.B34]
MTLPKEFKSFIEEEYGNYGWKLAYCFSFVAKYLGYKVLDISAVETSLKIVTTMRGTSLKNFEFNKPINFNNFIHQYYLKVHKPFTRRAKEVKLDNDKNEIERQQKVIKEFKNYMRVYPIFCFTSKTNNN